MDLTCVSSRESNSNVACGFARGIARNRKRLGRDQLAGLCALTLSPSSFFQAGADFLQQADDQLDVGGGGAPVDEAETQRVAAIQARRRDEGSAVLHQLVGDRVLVEAP